MVRLCHPLPDELQHETGQENGAFGVHFVEGLEGRAAGQEFRVPRDVVVLVQLAGFALHRVEHHVEELGVFAQVQKRVPPDVFHPLVVQVGLDGLLGGLLALEAGEIVPSIVAQKAGVFQVSFCLA